MSVGETALKVVITETVKGIWAAIPKAIDNWRFRRFFGVAAYEGNNIFGVVDPFSHPDPPHPKRYIKKFKGRRQGDALDKLGVGRGTPLTNWTNGGCEFEGVMDRNNTNSMRELV